MNVLTFRAVPLEGYHNQSRPARTLAQSARRQRIVRCLLDSALEEAYSFTGPNWPNQHGGVLEGV